MDTEIGGGDAEQSFHQARPYARIEIKFTLPPNWTNIGTFTVPVSPPDAVQVKGMADWLPFIRQALIFVIQSIDDGSITGAAVQILYPDDVS